jgi:hypothetical protein
MCDVQGVRMLRVIVRVGSGMLVCAAAMAQGEPPTYRCPGNLYTNGISPKEAAERGCRALEGERVKVIPAGPTRRAPAAEAPPPPRAAEAKVDPAEQKARDTDKRRILEGELRREQERLASLKAEFNNGEPERRGDERNYQKYLDRVAALKADIERAESDVGALRRELGKLGPARE